MPENTSKVSLLQNIALTVVTSSMLILIGYWLNGWLSRESLSIEYVRFISETQVQLPFKQLERNMRDLRLTARFQIWMTLFPSGASGCVMIPTPYTNNPNFTRETSKLLQSCLESFAENNEEDAKYLIKSLSALEKSPDQTDLNSIVAKLLNGISYAGSRPAQPDEVFKEPLQRKLQSTKRLLKDAIADSVEAGRLTSDSVEILKETKTVPTGRLLVVATIRNSGDTDGLIMSAPENCLILSKNAARLPIKLVGQFSASTSRFPPRSTLVDTVVSITKRGAASVAFILDPSLLPEPPRVAVTDLIKEYQYSDLRGKIILKDMRNRDLESREFPFPSSSQGQ